MSLQTHEHPALTETPFPTQTEPDPRLVDACRLLIRWMIESGRVTPTTGEQPILRLLERQPAEPTTPADALSRKAGDGDNGVGSEPAGDGTR